MGKTVSAAAVVAAALLLPPMAAACSCADLSPDEALRRADAVLIAKVIRLEVAGEVDGAQRIRATLRVLHEIKGAVPAELELTTTDGCCYCDMWYEIAHVYLLYLHRQDDGGTDFTTSTCARSSPVSEALEDLRALSLESWIRGGV